LVMRLTVCPSALNRPVWQQRTLVQNYGYFVRDKTGNEVDYVLEKGVALTLAEIKASKTLSSDHLKGIKYWKTTTKGATKDSFLIYAGDTEKTVDGTHVMSWTSASRISE